MFETGRITNTNQYGEPIVNCNDLMELVYQGYDVNKVKVNDDRVEKYNTIIEELGGSYIAVKNPNSTSSCGCGESFSA